MQDENRPKSTKPQTVMRLTQKPQSCKYDDKNFYKDGFAVIQENQLNAIIKLLDNKQITLLELRVFFAALVLQTHHKLILTHQLKSVMYSKQAQTKIDFALAKLRQKLPPYAEGKRYLLPRLAATRLAEKISKPEAFLVLMALKQHLPSNHFQFSLNQSRLARWSHFKQSTLARAIASLKNRNIIYPLYTGKEHYRKHGITYHFYGYKGERVFRKYIKKEEFKKNGNYKNDIKEILIKLNMQVRE